MFFKKNTMSKTEQTLNVNTVSRISQGTVFKGVMTSPSDIRLDGTYEGDIVSEGKVVIGEDALFKGNITCVDLDFWGQVEGEFVVKGTLSLHSGCRVKGKVRTRKLFVELGAEFNGNCTMIDEGEAAEEPVASVEE